MAFLSDYDYLSFLDEDLEENDDFISTKYNDDETFHGVLDWKQSRFMELCKTEGNFVKYAAIYYLAHQLFQSLYIIRNITKCKSGILDQIPFNKCDWFAEDCLDVNNVDMFKTTLKGFGAACLRKHQLGVYTDHIIEMMKFMIHAYLHKQSLKDFIKLLEDSLVHFTPKKIAHVKQRKKSMLYTKTASIYNDWAKKLAIKRFNMYIDPQAILTYKLKYSLEYERQCFNQTVLKYQMAEDALTEELETYKKMYVTEEQAGEHIIHFQIETIDNLSQRYNYLKSMYEEQEMTIVHENEYVKRQITKLQQRQKYYESEMERFEYEIYAIQNNIKLPKRPLTQVPHHSSINRPSNDFVPPSNV